MNTKKFALIAILFVSAFPFTGNHLGAQDNGDDTSDQELVRELTDRFYRQANHGLEKFKASGTAKTEVGGEGGMKMKLDFELLWRAPDRKKIKTSNEKEGRGNPIKGILKKTFTSLSEFVISSDFSEETLRRKFSAKERDEGGYALTYTTEDNEITYLFNKEKELQKLKLPKPLGMELDVETRSADGKILITKLKNKSDDGNGGSDTEITIEHKKLEIGEDKTVLVGEKVNLKMKQSAGGGSPAGGNITITLSDMKTNDELPEDFLKDKEEGPETDNDENEGGENEEEKEEGSW